MEEKQVQREEFLKAYLPAAAVSASLIAAVIIYAAVGMLISRHGAVPPVKPPASYALKYMFYFFSAGAFVFIQRFLPPASGTAAVELLKALMRRSIIRAAAAELPALCGLLLLALTGASADFMLLLAFSLGMELAFFPRQGEWREKLRAGCNLPGN